MPSRHEQKYLSRKPGYHQELRRIIDVSIKTHQPFIKAVQLAEKLVTFPEDMTSSQKREVARQYVRRMVDRQLELSPMMTRDRILAQIAIMLTNWTNKANFSLSYEQLIEEYQIQTEYRPKLATSAQAVAS